MKLIYLTMASFLLISPAVAADMTEDFEVIDVNHDGVITSFEMATAQRATLSTQNESIMKMLDKDGNGSVTNEEYMSFYGKLASSDKELEQVKNQFTALDADGNGEISADELGSFRQGSLDTENEEFFKAVDADKDGQVTHEEYDAFVEGLKGIFSAFGSDF